MSNYVTQMSKNGGSPFLVMDEEARASIAEEITNRQNAVSGEATLRENAVSGEANARSAADTAEATARQAGDRETTEKLTEDISRILDCKNLANRGYFKPGYWWNGFHESSDYVYFSFEMETGVIYEAINSARFIAIVNKSTGEQSDNSINDAHTGATFSANEASVCYVTISNENIQKIRIAKHSYTPAEVEAYQDYPLKESIMNNVEYGVEQIAKKTTDYTKMVDGPTSVQYKYSTFSGWGTDFPGRETPIHFSKLKFQILNREQSAAISTVNVMIGFGQRSSITKLLHDYYYTVSVAAGETKYCEITLHNTIKIPAGTPYFIALAFNGLISMGMVDNEGCHSYYVTNGAYKNYGEYSDGAPGKAIEVYGFGKKYTLIGQEEAPTVSMYVPEKYDLIVGDRFELFYKGILKTFNDKGYYVRAVCEIGKNIGRKFIATPASAGNYTLALAAINQYGVVEDEKNVTLAVHGQPNSPQSEKVILCVGDSLTAGGIWPHEMKRRLTGNGGTPSGYNMSNLAFIGTCEYDGVKFEGYGGWNWNDYNTNSRTSEDTKQITCTHDKTEADDQHSIYEDGEGNTWKLETIETGKIKIILDDGDASTLPSTGTLTHVSGGLHTSDIVYTSVSDVPGNPFWNSDTEQVDFGAYATSQGKSKIDYVYVLLGWNNWWTGMSTIKSYAQTFITNVHAAFPNAKVVLMGLEMPSQEGLGSVYNANQNINDYVKMQKFVFDLEQVYDELADSNSNVIHINISGQFDTEYNMPHGTRYPNERNSETTIDMQTNGVHPSNNGYMQIADAAVRHISGLI